MEAACNRCHQSVPADSCFCPNCGLPQLVYTSDEPSAATPAERWTGAVHDAAAVEWRSALRLALLLAVPAGLLSSGQSPVWGLFLLWMAAAAAWTVTLYARRQRPGWITVGAGARIGMVTGLLAGWISFAATAVALYAARFAFGQGKDFDSQWQSAVAQAQQQWQSVSTDAQTTATINGFYKLLLTPEGKSGSLLAILLILQAIMLAFAVAGGAIGARLIARRRPQP